MATKDNSQDRAEQQPGAESPRMDRRRFLSRSGTLLAAIGAYGVAAGEASAAPVQGSAVAKGYHVMLDVIDQVDGFLVIRPSMQAVINGRMQMVADLKADDGFSIDIVQGAAQVLADSYTGNFLIAPAGDAPVVARGAVRSAEGMGEKGVLYGEEVALGTSPFLIPENQRSVAVAGGGACTAKTRLSASTGVPQQLIDRFSALGLDRGAVLALAQNYDFKLRVRACIAGNVIPRSSGHREIPWQHGLYFAHDPMLGRMRLRYNPAYASKTVMQSDAAAPSAATFFPASGVNQLYFVLEFLDLGYRCFNKEPMNLHFNNANWPPYAAPLDIEKPISFYNVDNPDEIILDVYENTMKLYDYAAIDIEPVHYEVDGHGLIRSRWRIRNQASVPIKGQWFVLGDVLEDVNLPDQGIYEFGAAGTEGDTVEFNYTGRLSKRSLSQFITMNLVSYDDPVIVGTKRISFRYPA